MIKTTNNTKQINTLCLDAAQLLQEIPTIQLEDIERIITKTLYLLQIFNKIKKLQNETDHS